MPALAQLNEGQESVRVPLAVDAPGRYILVVHYLTPPGQPTARQVTVETSTSTGESAGRGGRGDRERGNVEPLDGIM